MCSAHFYAWRLGLKTGQYYLRSRPAVDPIKFTLDVQELLKESGGVDLDGLNNFNAQVSSKNSDNNGKTKKVRMKKRVKRRNSRKNQISKGNGAENL